MIEGADVLSRWTSTGTWSSTSTPSPPSRTLPALRSTMVLVAVFSFLFSWDDFRWPLIVLSDPARHTLTIGLSYLQGTFVNDQSPTSTGGSRELAAQRLGAAQERVLEEVTSRMAAEDERAALRLTGAVVVTQVLRTVLLADGRIVEVAVKVCSGQTVLRWSTPLGE